MQTEPTKLSEELARKAQVCETIAQDMTEAALTGDSSEKNLNEEEARAWRAKCKLWQEAEAIVKASSARQSPPGN